jgi:hypothetical protein
MTSTAILSQLSTFSISSTAGGAKTITSVSIGNPAIITSTAHGLANGDVVAIAGIVGTVGTSLLNGMQAVVRRVTANTFSIDVDTTGLVYTSGGAATPNTWTPISNIKSFTAFDGSAANIEVSNLQSAAKEYLVGLKDLGTFSLEVDLDTTDAGQMALLAAQSSQAKKQFRLVLPNAATATFYGFAKKVGAAGGVDQSMKRSIEVLITGDVTWS